MEVLELIRYKNARKVFETLLKFKGKQFTISELARESHVPFAAAWRLIKKWEPAGIVETNAIGGSRVVRLHESEYTKRITELLKLSISPQKLTVEALKKELKSKNIKEVYLFGSVVKGKEKLESDIDLAILAGKGFDTNKLMFEIYERYGTKVVPLTFENKKELKIFLKDKENERII